MLARSGPLERRREPAAADATVRAMVQPICAQPEQEIHLSKVDVAMRRLLRLPPQLDPGASEAARAAFRTSILISSFRCLLTYIVLPFVLPLVGLAAGVGAALGLVISLVALWFMTSSVRRFWRVHHRKRWHYTGLAAVVALLLVVGIGFDIAALV
jgi:hypothetical protein